MLVYAVTIFTGAFLLFQVQPLIAKYILPWFGGGPGVWTTCMLFFQVLLLGGYAYAHVTSRWLSPRRQSILHLVLLAAALILLPITPNDSWKPQGAGNPTLQILALLAVCIGLPYFVLSATGPLVQHWFSRSQPGISPYRLYALSNLGSLLALVSYPFYFESHFTRHTQASLWAWGLAAYAVACGFCAVRLWQAEGRRKNEECRMPNAECSDTQHATRNTQHAPLATPAPPLNPQPSTLNQLLWLLLPACASVLLLATTNKMCQDVAVIPFLWVLPLALYLLSFIICFDSPRWYKRLPFGLALGVALGGVCWAMFQVKPAIGGFAAGLFICCMVCHGELYRLKPDPRHLTGYYLMIAAGGALGGLFVAVIAPLIFTDYFELHWGLLLCGLLFLVVCLRECLKHQSSSSCSSPSPSSSSSSSLSLSSVLRMFSTTRTRGSATLTAVGGCDLSRLRWPACALLAVGLVALGVALWVQAHRLGSTRLYRARNFYGVLTVNKHGALDVPAIALVHGSTRHGLQFRDPVLAAWPTAYFNERSGVGLAMSALPAGSRRIGVVGLGAGTLAAYGQAGDYLRFYEMNPDVLRLANSHFTYLAHCQGKVEVVLGDGRLSLEREPPQNFDLLILDAFNGGAPPVHLLTREAFEVYERHLKTNGIIAVNISNSHLNLEPVAANLARRFHYESAIIEYRPLRDQWWNLNSVWVLLSHNKEFINSPAIRQGARPPEAVAGTVPLWTDDFASLFQIVRWSRIRLLEVPAAEAQAEVADRLWGQGDFAGAMAYYRRALENDPGQVQALNNLAWLLAACPDASLRSGAEAVQLAEKACQLAEYHSTTLVGTLAAAYAEAGRLPEAVATGQKACELASLFKEQALLAKNRKLLELYRAGQPYHEPPEPQAQP